MVMEQVKIGIIGGSGLYEMADLTERKEIPINTPFGSPSDNLIVGSLCGQRVAFLARHGRGHRWMPSEINFRANGKSATLEIRDFGVGLPSEMMEGFQKNGNVVGVGLSSMKERVRERNGKFELRSDSSGTAILVTLPVGS